MTIAVKSNGNVWMRSGGGMWALPSSGGGGAPEGFLVPAVPSGLETDTALPTLPSPWSSSTSGFYYVKQGGSAGNNGTPAAPRGTMPTGVPAGSVIVLDNTASLSLSFFQWSFTGTSGSPIWVVGSQKYALGSGSTRAIVQYTSDGETWGDYVRFDGIDFFSNTTNQSGVIFGGFSNRVQNWLIRDCHFRGSGAFRAANSSNALGGISTTERTNDIVFYQCDFYDMGDYAPDSAMSADTDVLGLQISDWVEDVWILECNFYRNQSDGLQFTPGNPSTAEYDVVRRVYLQDCTAYQNLQGGMWNKIGDDIIFARCIMHDMHRSANAHADTSISHGFGGQYTVGKIWYLFCQVYNCDDGIRFASDLGTPTTHAEIYVVGCIFSDIDTVTGTSSSSSSEGTAIGLWQEGSGVAHHIVHNTIWRFNGHGIAFNNGVGDGAQVEGNIINGRLNSAYFDIIAESYTTSPTIKNNVFPSSPRFAMDNGNTLTHSAIATFESADSSNRSGNVAADITFANAIADAAGDFTPAGGSSNIGIGALSTDVYTTYEGLYGIDIRMDFEGTARPVGGTYDAGAIEQ